MRVGYLGSFYHLLHGGILHSEGDVVIEGIVKEDSLLIDITNKRAQIADTQPLDVLPVNEHLPLLYIMVAGNQIHQCRFTRTRLPYQRNSLALGNG